MRPRQKYICAGTRFRKAAQLQFLFSQFKFNELRFFWLASQCKPSVLDIPMLADQNGELSVTEKS